MINDGTNLAIINQNIIILRLLCSLQNCSPIRKDAVHHCKSASGPENHNTNTPFVQFHLQNDLLYKADKTYNTILIKMQRVALFDIIYNFGTTIRIFTLRWIEQRQRMTPSLKAYNTLHSMVPTELVKYAKKVKVVKDDLDRGPTIWQVVKGEHAS